MTTKFFLNEIAFICYVGYLGTPRKKMGTTIQSFLGKKNSKQKASKCRIYQQGVGNFGIYEIHVFSRINLPFFYLPIKDEINNEFDSNYCRIVLPES